MAAVRVASVRVDFEIDPVMFGSVRGHIDVADLRVTANLRLTADRGGLVASLEGATAEVGDVSFDIRGIPGVIENLDPIRNAVRDKVRDGIQDAVADQLPGLVSDQLAGIPTEHDINLIDTPLHL